MKRKIYATLLAFTAVALGAMAAVSGNVRTENVSFSRGGGKINVNADIVLDSLTLKNNQQIFMTPVLSGESDSIALPTVLITGRGMHYAYERGTMRGLKEYRRKYDIMREVRRDNGRSQMVDYTASAPFAPWMRTERLSIQFRYDTCGCGVFAGSGVGPSTDTTFNPVPSMRVAYITPKVTDLPVSIHEGSARVQFEVDKTVLHDSVYRARSGQRIDNRQQLKVIYDSIAYALTDPNAEIAKIEIIGYASPESPYEHNKELATGRSRALAEYIGKYVGRKYNIDQNVASFDAVPENWVEFREQVVNAKDITEQQRQDLLALIDRPAFGAADYDAKEKELKTDPKFRDLYRTKILPQWFPHLRATKFRISTRLKPLADPQLAEVIMTAPEKMSLNQMMRVARLYPEGSAEFDKVIDTALRYYPSDEEANLNAAVSAIRGGNYDRAAALLDKAGDSPEAVNARAVVLAHNGDFDAARRLLETIPLLPEAQKNLNLLLD